MGEKRQTCNWQCLELIFKVTLQGPSHTPKHWRHNAENTLRWLHSCEGESETEKRPYEVPCPLRGASQGARAAGQGLGLQRVQGRCAGRLPGERGAREASVGCCRGPCAGTRPTYPTCKPSRQSRGEPGEPGIPHPTVNSPSHPSPSPIHLR